MDSADDPHVVHTDQGSKGPKGTEEEQQSRADVKYQSYKQYIGTLLGSWPEYRDLYEYLGSSLVKWSELRNSDYEQTLTQFVIIDYTDTSTKTKIFRQDDESVEPEMFTVALNTFTEGVKTRVILVTPCEWVPVEAIDALGMALDVDPAFFHVAIRGIVWEARNSMRIEARWEPWIYETFGKCVMLPPLVCSQVIQVRINASTSIDVVLIFAAKDLWPQPSPGVLGYGRPSIHKPDSFRSPGGPGDTWWHATYSHSLAQRAPTFERFVQDLKRGRFHSPNDEPLQYVCPLIWLAIQRISDPFSKLRGDLEFHSDWPRRVDEDQMMAMIERGADAVRGVESFCCVTRTLAKQCSSVPERRSGVLLDVKRYCQYCLEDGERLCKLAQDWIHIRNGLASTIDSDRSIEEAVSIKRLSRLAFIFIPLAYTATLFGMNVRQMNGNGPGLWTFVVVSVCISIIILLMSSLSKWVDRYGRRTCYPLRDYIIYGLIGLRFGLLLWMIRRGFILAMLSGGRFESSDPVIEIKSKIRARLGLVDYQDVWPPPRGFNRFYFRTNASSDYDGDSARVEQR